MHSIYTSRHTEVFFAALKLGLTSFGGPVAHIGYFHVEYVQNKKWLDEHAFADLVALCHMLPGPASSQLGMAIGSLRAGFWGGILAWLGFTLPSAALLTLFALFMQHTHAVSATWIHGLKIAALVLVLQAVMSMWKKLITTYYLALIAVLSTIAALLWQGVFAQLSIIVTAGLAGLLQSSTSPTTLAHSKHWGVHHKAIGLCCLFLFFALLVLLPLLRAYNSHPLIALSDSFYRAGALVFGGGHVVLPLLEQEFVQQGVISKDTFLAGYGTAQAIPGPLFTFAAFLGASIAGLHGAWLATLAIFLPAYLLVMGCLPFWSALKQNTTIHMFFACINAAVVGLLMAALYHPLGTSTLQRPVDIVFTLGLCLLVWVIKLPPLAIVVVGVLGSLLIYT